MEAAQRMWATMMEERRESQPTPASDAMMGIGRMETEPDPVYSTISWEGIPAFAYVKEIPGPLTRKWKEMISGVMLMYYHAVSGSLLQITAQNRESNYQKKLQEARNKYGDELPTPAQKLAAASKSRNRRLVPRAKGRALDPSKAVPAGGWPNKSELCTHPETALEAQGNQSKQRAIRCKLCGARWENVAEPTIKDSEPTPACAPVVPAVELSEQAHLEMMSTYLMFRSNGCDQQQAVAQLYTQPGPGQAAVINAFISMNPHLP